jgi:hypothetical protein
VLPLVVKDALMRQVFSHTTAFRLASVVTAITVLVTTGFAIAGVVAPASILPPSDAPTDASFVFALYAAAARVPLAGFVFVAIYKRSSSLLLLGSLAGTVQFLDAGIGVMQHDPGKIGGPLIVAVLQMLALWGLSRSMPKQPVASLGA